MVAPYARRFGRLGLRQTEDRGVSDYLRSNENRGRSRDEAPNDHARVLQSC